MISYKKIMIAILQFMGGISIKGCFILKVVSLNVNGLRAAARKGFFDWVASERPDVLCLQEVRALPEQIEDSLYQPEGYYRYLNPAVRKGYSGTAIYTRRRPDRVIKSLGWKSADDEGRYLQVDFGDMSIASIYLPSGSSSEVAQARKFDFLAQLMPILVAHRAVGRAFIICGDWNIAHTEADLKNWRGNRKNSGFLPEERAWLDQLFNQVGWVDAFRCINQEPDQYTWWSNRGRAWDNNVGWRIDYQLCTPEMVEYLQSAAIYKASRFSDHAPLTMEWTIPEAFINPTHIT